MMRLLKCNISSVLLFGVFAGLVLTSCSDNDDNGIKTNTDEDDYKYVGQAVGNFSAEEWYPGGNLGTTENTSGTCYQDETPAIEATNLGDAFKKGEYMFEHYFSAHSPIQALTGLGPAYVRSSCIDCHPGYGHGRRMESYRANMRGNGYLLVIYHPVDGANSNDGPYISEVTGMPQTRATSPFLPPVDESGIHLSWKPVTAMESGLPMTFPDGEAYSLIYPELSIDIAAFNTDPKPTNLAFRLESTIGLYGTGLIDAIPQDSIKKQYQHEAKYLALNPVYGTRIRTIGWQSRIGHEQRSMVSVGRRHDEGEAVYVCHDACFVARRAGCQCHVEYHKCDTQRQTSVVHHHGMGYGHVEDRQRDCSHQEES